MKKAVLCAAFAAVLAVLAAPVAMGHHDPGGVVVGGLFNPRGIDVSRSGSLFVAESGSGEISKIRLRGRHAPSVSTFATLPTLPGGPEDDPPALGPVEVAVSGGKKYVLMSGPPRGTDGFARLLQVRRNGTTRLIADIAAYQKGDPDPYDQADPPFPEESNPNGLAVLHGGKFLVADAANNDLLLIDSKRDTITTVARFKPSMVPFPFPGPPPGTLVPAEAVPTAVAVGPDGAWYVSQLLGFPFTKGASHIWRIEPWSVGATCDPAQPNQGRCRSFASGFTSVIDLAFGEHGKLYVLEIAKNGLLDAGLGALWRVNHGAKTELVPGTLFFPGGVAIGHDDDLFVTTGAVFGPGAGAVVRVPD